ncbi:virginiamycin B lyase family protein [Priestia aryabhattai]|uniref:Vgb family protein n=1 Tax=Priestia aryabhattai TaxID=412384 RepID=UPI003D293A3F
MKGNRVGVISQDGEITEYDLPDPGAYPSFIVAGTDDALWFTEWGSNQIGRITVNGKITEYPIPTKNAEPHGIVVGSDQALWFAEECNKLGRLSFVQKP